MNAMQACQAPMGHTTCGKTRDCRKRLLQEEAVAHQALHVVSNAEGDAQHGRQLHECSVCMIAQHTVQAGEQGQAIAQLSQRGQGRLPVTAQNQHLQPSTTPSAKVGYMNELIAVETCRRPYWYVLK